MEPVSIVIISKNEENDMEDCMNSLKRLDYPKFEVVVVDASTDRTPDIARKYGARVVKDAKGSFPGARNIGTMEAKYGIIAFTDADCVVPADWLKKAVHFLEDGRVGAISGNAYPPKNSTYTGLCIACLGFPAGGAIGLDSMGKELSTSNAIFRKGVLDEVGGFNEELIYGGEDTDISRRIVDRGYSIKYVKDSFVYHKTRSLCELKSWCIRRGKTRRHVNSSINVVLLPISVFGLFFTKRYRLLLGRRKDIGIGLFSILISVPFLFFFKQIFTFWGFLTAKRSIPVINKPRNDRLNAA